MKKMKIEVRAIIPRNKRGAGVCSKLIRGREIKWT